MKTSLKLQAGTIRHFLPYVEKTSGEGSILDAYRDALKTLEYFAERAELLRQLRDHTKDRLDLEVLFDQHR